MHFDLKTQQELKDVQQCMPNAKQRLKPTLEGLGDDRIPRVYERFKQLVPGLGL